MRQGFAGGVHPHWFSSRIVGWPASRVRASLPITTWVRLGAVLQLPGAGAEAAGLHGHGRQRAVAGRQGRNDGRAGRGGHFGVNVQPVGGPRRPAAQPWPGLGWGMMPCAPLIMAHALGYGAGTETAEISRISRALTEPTMSMIASTAPHFVEMKPRPGRCCGCALRPGPAARRWPWARARTRSGSRASSRMPVMCRRVSHHRVGGALVADHIGFWWLPCRLAGSG